MADLKKMTIQELLEAPLEDLSVDEMVKRGQVITLMRQERELEVVNSQNQQFADQKEQRQRESKVKRENIAQEYAENQRIKGLCKHKTGGKDRQGFYQGDGDIYGYAVARQQLPTKEFYVLCFRCQREWHSPIWWAELPDGSRLFDGRRAVMDGKMPLPLYFRQEREYREAMEWPAKTFEGIGGEWPASSTFNIPKLDQQLQKSAAEFEQYLKKVPANELVMAGYRPAA
jgi:hypothetical protein